MYGIRSGPPTSYERDSDFERRAPTNASTTSTTAIGCTRLSIHAGTACTGIRSLICRTISKLVDPEPGHDGGPQGDGADAGARAAQDALDLEPRRDVLAQLVLGHVGHQAAEVDDGPHTRHRAGVGHRLGRRAVAGGEVLAAHPVDQVVHGVHALDGGVDGVGVEHVHLHQLDLVGPPAVAGLVEVGDGGPHGVAVGQQPRDQAAADVARGTGDEDGCRRVGVRGAAPVGHAPNLGRVRRYPASRGQPSTARTPCVRRGPPCVSRVPALRFSAAPPRVSRGAALRSRGPPCVGAVRPAFRAVPGLRRHGPRYAGRRAVRPPDVRGAGRAGCRGVSRRAGGGALPSSARGGPGTSPRAGSRRRHRRSSR